MDDSSHTGSDTQHVAITPDKLAFALRDADNIVHASLFQNLPGRTWFTSADSPPFGGFAVTFFAALVSLWFKWRRDRREQALFEARMETIKGGGTTLKERGDS